MPELEIGFVDGGELNFANLFCSLMERKKIYVKSSSQFI